MTTPSDTINYPASSDTESESGSDLPTTSFYNSTTENPTRNPNSNMGRTHPQTDSSATTINRISINQDHSCFAVGFDTGFRVFSCDPYELLFRRDFDSGGIGVVAMLFKSNVMCLVGGGSQPQYSINKVMVWDDHRNRWFGELSFRSEVKDVKLRRDRIVVVLEQTVHVYNFADLKIMNQIETVSNPQGLCDVSHTAGPMILVCPGLLKGQVRVEDCGSKKIKYIMAHHSKLACLAMTIDGRFLATASSRGTLIRVFNTSDGSLLQEVRRGAHKAEIYSIAFSSDAQWLAASSGNGTIHVFGLKVDSGSMVVDRTNSTVEPDLERSLSSSSTSSLSFIKGVLPTYFSSEWSVAQFRLQESVRYIVVFGSQKNTVVIIGMDGSYYKCEFNPANGGEMTQLEYYNFLKAEEPV